MQTRFDVALALAMASQAPADQIRKGAENSVEMAPRWPYIIHPVTMLTVVTFVQRFGGTEGQVVEALLHDVVKEEGGAGVV